MSSELKRCPFCGEEAEIERPGTAMQSMIVACTNCSTRMESGDVIGLTPPESYAWNRRFDPRIQKAREALLGTQDAMGVLEFTKASRLIDEALAELSPKDVSESLEVDE
jgi:hypothetical protein